MTMKSPQEVAQACIALYKQGAIQEAFSTLAGSRAEALTIPCKQGIDVNSFASSLATYCLDSELWELAIQAFSLNESHDDKPNNSSERSHTHRSAFQQAAEHVQTGNISDAIRLFCQSIGENPCDAAATRNLALLLKRKGNYRDAKTFADRYIAMRPSCSHGWNTYATILDAIGDNKGAIDALIKALDLDPTNVNACSNLAHQYHVLSKLDSAYLYSCKAISGRPDDPDLLLSHITHVNRICSFAERNSIDVWKLFRELPAEKVIHFALQLLTNCETDQQSQEVASMLRDWRRPTVLSREGKTFTVPDSSADIPQEDVLTIGFVSGDFKDHSVARFIWPIFSRHDKEKFRLLCYSTCPASDAWQQRFRASSHRFYDVADTSEAEFVNLVRRDQVDILFDLTGFTKGSRTYLFANRMAPVQIAWLGFPGTTGLRNMDYIFVDRFLAPTDPSLTVESLLITRGTSVCFSGMEDIPITPSLPQQTRGFITFGTLNNTYKITSACIRRWASVMRRFEGSRFYFVRREFDSALLRGNLIDEFARFGIDSSRLAFFNNRKANRHYLDCYNEIDITLDTYPVTGGTTTVDALWMGVPVVTLEGNNIHQRVCSAVLRHLGCESWIATSESDYIDIATRLANDVGLRLSLRSNLRGRIRSSILCDSEQFANDFADAMVRARETTGFG